MHKPDNSNAGPAEPVPAHTLSRRELLGRLGALGLLAGAMPWLSGCPGGSTWEPAAVAAGAADAAGSMPPGELRLPLPSLAPGEVQDWQAGAAKGFVMLGASGQWVAISRVCTHSRCKVNFRAQQGDFWCPCHKSTFDLEGNVLRGPAKRPLPHYPVRQEGSELVLDLSNVGPADLAKPDKGAGRQADEDDDSRGRGRDAAAEDDDTKERSETPGWNP